MHLYGISVFQQQQAAAANPRNPHSAQACKRLRALAAVVLTLAAGMPMPNASLRAW